MSRRRGSVCGVWQWIGRAVRIKTLTVRRHQSRNDARMWHLAPPLGKPSAEPDLAGPRLPRRRRVLVGGAGSSTAAAGWATACGTLICRVCPEPSSARSASASCGGKRLSCYCPVAASIWSATSWSGCVASTMTALLAAALPAAEAAPPARTGTPYWMESALWQASGIPTVVCGPAGGGLHAVDEWVDLALLRRSPVARRCGRPLPGTVSFMTTEPSDPRDPPGVSGLFICT